MSILLESPMTEPPSQSTSQPDLLGSHDSKEAGGYKYPFTGFRPSSFTAVERQRLDSARHFEACTPIRDSSRLASTDEILAATAHELRLPLSHIKGFVTSLRRTDVDWDDETRSEFIAEIDLETDRLAEIVESLLAAHAPGSSYTPSMDMAFTHPASVVEGARQRIRGLFGERPLRVDVPSTVPSVRMDASQMERVLANLIHNAIKYSPEGTAIGISARITDDAELELSVEDEGPGIPAQDRERIFEPFFRKQSADHSHVPGHGLGLAICRSIVLAHRGRIQVRNRRRGGARFSVFLPAQVRAKQVNSNSQPKDRSYDSAKHSGGGRRAADAQAPLEQSDGQRLRRTFGSGRHRGTETVRGAPVRPAAG
jgi:signal transduction histidine kinase